MSFIPNIFAPHGRYRVKQNFKSGPASDFITGEVLIFERQAYSRYDNCFVYQFKTEGGNAPKEWWLPEKYDPEVWRDHFEIIPY